MAGKMKEYGVAVRPIRLFFSVLSVGACVLPAESADAPASAIAVIPASVIAVIPSSGAGKAFPVMSGAWISISGPCSCRVRYTRAYAEYRMLIMSSEKLRLLILTMISE